LKITVEHPHVEYIWEVLNRLIASLPRNTLVKLQIELEEAEG